MLYTIVNMILVIIALVFIFLGLYSKKDLQGNTITNFYKKLKLFVNENYKFLIIFLFIVTVFTSIYKIGTVPYGMHVDEAGMAYDAISISKYGVDRYLNQFPVYLTNYGGGQSAMYAYLAIPFIKLFGYSPIAVRMPAVILRLIIFICGFFTIKNEKSKTKSLTFLLLLTTVPYFIMQSRWGLDCNLLVGFLTISICLLIQAINKNSYKILIASGILFGLSLYTYALSYIIIPILLFFICIYLLYIKKLNFRKLIVLGIPIFLLALPLMLMILINNGYTNEFKGFITIPLLRNYRGAEISLHNIPNNLYIFTSILSYDNPGVFGNLLIYNSLPYFGTIYYFTIPFFIIGLLDSFTKLYHSIKKKEFNISNIFLFWLFSVVICQLLIVEPNINKANAIFVPIVYFSAMGIVYCSKKIKLLIVLICIILLINFALFFNYYFYHYNEDNMNQYFFATSYLDAVEYARSLQKETIYIEPNLTSQSYIHILLNNQVSPYEYSENNIKTTYNNSEITYVFGIPEEISDMNAVYIIGNNDYLLNLLKSYNFSVANFGNISVFYQNNN